MQHYEYLHYIIHSYLANFNPDAHKAKTNKKVVQSSWINLVAVQMFLRDNFLTLTFMKFLVFLYFQITFMCYPICNL